MNVFFDAYYNLHEKIVIIVVIYFLIDILNKFIIINTIIDDYLGALFEGTIFFFIVG